MIKEGGIYTRDEEIRVVFEVITNFSRKLRTLVLRWMLSWNEIFKEIIRNIKENRTN